MDNEFAGLIALVTGGGAGIGKAIAQALLDRGARVAVFDKVLTDAPPAAECFAVDVGSDEQVAAAVEQFGSAHGRIDLLVNNAGISYPATIEDGSLEDWHRVLDINVLGYVRTTRAALPFLRRSEAASIVNMSSCTAATGLRRPACGAARCTPRPRAPSRP